MDIIATPPDETDGMTARTSRPVEITAKSKESVTDDASDDDVSIDDAELLSFSQHQLRNEPQHEQRSSCMTVKTQRESIHESTHERCIAAARRRSLKRTPEKAATDDSVASTATTQRLSISFDTLTLREYPILLGDNPGGPSGPPLTIDWKYVGDETIMPVDDYETLHPERRSQPELRMPPDVRESMLRNVGYSRSEIRTGCKPVIIARRERAQTLNTMRFFKLHEVQESLLRKANSIVTLGSRKRQERELLAPFRRSSWNDVPRRSSLDGSKESATTIQSAGSLERFGWSSAPV